MGERLKAAGIPYVNHADRFAHDSPDDEWLALPGAEGWPVVTRDKRWRYRANESAAYSDAKVLGFVFLNGNLSGRQTADALVKAYPAILKIAATVKRPAIYSIGADGSVRPLQLDKRLRQPRTGARDPGSAPDSPPEEVPSRAIE
jgi:hypothetical protein